MENLLICRITAHPAPLVRADITAHLLQILIAKFSMLDAFSRQIVVDYVLSVADAILSDSAAPSAFAVTPIERIRAEKPQKEWTDAELDQ